EAVRFDVERQNGIAGGARKPHGPRLCDARRPARTVESEADRASLGEVAPHLTERACRPARGRAARHAEAEPLDDAGDPLPVEVLARHDDDAAMTEIVEAAKDSAVPERHDRLAS